MKKLLTFVSMIAVVLSSWAAVQRGDTFTLGNFNYQINFAASSTERAEAIITGFSSAGKSTSFTNLTLGGIITYNGEQIDVETVSSRAFEGQTNFTEVTFSYGMRDIGTYAFNNCTKLKTLHLPSSMRSIQGNAFAGCTALQVVYHALSDPTGCTFNTSAFPSGQTMLLYVPKTHPNSVQKYQAMSAFKKFTMVIKSSDACDFSLSDGAQLVVTSRASLSNIGGVTVVGFNGNASGAISGNFLPSCGTNYYNLLGYRYNIVAVADSACLLNSKLKSVDLSNINGIKKIGVSAFQRCDYLTSAKVMAVEIGNSAFRYNKALTSFVIKENTITMGEKVLEGSEQLTSIVIPKSMTSLNKNAFDACPKLASITVTAGNPNYLSSSGILFNGSGERLMRCPQGKTGALTEEMFADNFVLVEDSAFYNCEKITEVRIPLGVTSLGKSAFENCKAMTLLKLPKTVNKIDNRAFCNCISLADVLHAKQYVEEFLGTELFTNCKKGRLHILKTSGYRNYFAEDAQWGKWTSVVDDLSYDIRELNFVSADGKQKAYSYYFLIEGTPGYGSDKNKYDGAVTLRHQDQLPVAGGTLRVPDYVTACGRKYAVTAMGLPFRGGSIGYDDMYSVFGSESSDKQPFEFTLELGKNVTAIYYNAFKDQSKLVNLKLNSNLKRIDGHAFDGCKISNDLYLPLTLTQMEGSVFCGNDFKRILVPSSCYDLYFSSFNNCKNLTDIIFNVHSTAILSGVLDGNNINSNCTVYVSVDDLDAYKVSEKFKNVKIMPGAYDFSYNHLNDATPYHMTVISHSQVTTSDGITYDGKAKYVYNPFVTISSPKPFYCSKSETDKTNNSGKKYLMVEMGDNCLNGASNITSVTLQDMTYLNKIGNQAFAGSGITSLTVPEGVTYFGEKAVYGCKSLTELIFNIKHTEWELGNSFYGNNGGQFYCFVPWEYYDFYRSKLPAGSSRPSEKAPREQLNAYLYKTMSGHKACLAVDHPVDWEKSGLKAWNVSDYDESTLTVRATPITATPANHGVLVDWYDLNTGSVQKLYRPQSTPTAPATVLTGVSEPLDIAPIGVWNVGYKYNPDIYGVPNNETFNHPSDAYYIKPGYAYMALDKTRVTTTSGTYIKVVYGDTPTPGGKKGDVNGDGEVDVTDANILTNIILGKDSASNYGGRADVDGNGEVDVTDANLVTNIILGK